MSTSTPGRAAGQPRTAFVLAGAAALAAMPAGMVHAPYERGIAPDLLTGTSAGALNAAFPASRPATVATAHELAAPRSVEPGPLAGGRDAGRSSQPRSTHADQTR